VHSRSTKLATFIYELFYIGSVCDKSLNFGPRVPFPGAGLYQRQARRARMASCSISTRRDQSMVDMSRMDTSWDSKPSLPVVPQQTIVPSVGGNTHKPTQPGQLAAESTNEGRQRMEAAAGSNRCNIHA
jgi:hypothetical protein